MALYALLHDEKAVSNLWCVMRRATACVRSLGDVWEHTSTPIVSSACQCSLSIIMQKKMIWIYNFNNSSSYIFQFDPNSNDTCSILCMWLPTKLPLWQACNFCVCDYQQSYRCGKLVDEHAAAPTLLVTFCSRVLVAFSSAPSLTVLGQFLQLLSDTNNKTENRCCRSVKRLLTFMFFNAHFVSEKTLVFQ